MGKLGNLISKNPLAAAGAGLSLIGTVGSMFGIKKANRRLDQLLAQDPTYKQSPYAQQSLDLAKRGFGLAGQYLNGRMAGASQLERNLQTAQGNSIDAIGRNATDASQALAAVAGAQGQTDQSLANLQTQEAQNKYNMLGNYNTMLGNLNNAYGTMINEGDKVYNDQVRHYGNLVSVRGAQQQNRQAPWQSLSNLGNSLMGYGAAQGNNGGGNQTMNRANGFSATQLQAPTYPQYSGWNSIGMNSSPAAAFGGGVPYNPMHR